VIEPENQERERRGWSIAGFLSWWENFAIAARYKWWLSRWKGEPGRLRFMWPGEDEFDPRRN